MLREEQLSILRDISQSVAFADDRNGKVGELIADGYLFELTAKGITAVEEHAAALAASDGPTSASSDQST